MGNGTYRSIYATFDGTLHVAFRGLAASRAHYLHLHYPGSYGMAWLVAKR